MFKNTLLNILLYWTLWKKDIPEWLNNSKSMVLINYTSEKLIKILPNNSLKKVEELFNISLDNGVKEFINNEKQLDKYNEPVINLKKDEGSLLFGGIHIKPMISKFKFKTT